MEFRIDLAAAAQRRIHVALSLAMEGAIEGSDAVELRMPVWTPGSYLVREYARHLSGFRAADADDGRPLRWRKTAKNRYLVESVGARRLAMEWVVYAHALTVREAYVSAEFAFWNGACILLWPVGLERGPAEVRVRLPDGWRLHCGIEAEHGDREARFVVAGLDEAVDTPCVAARSLQRFEFQYADRPHAFVCAGLGPIPLPDTLVRDTASVVHRAAQVFGGDVPYRTYTFLALFGAARRGGLEHASSSCLVSPRTAFHPRRAYEEYLGLVAHEFFHAWNGTRMRPTDLWRIDYDAENYTELLWVVEGFTAYYDDLICLRAGVLTAKSYLQIVAQHVEALRAMPGRFAQSLSESSYDAWIRFYRPDENTRNSTQNYYSNGALAALCIDAWIRDATAGERSLDDAMRDLYRRTYCEGRGYTRTDVDGSICDAAGRDLRPAIASLVDGPLDPDLDQVLGIFGFRIVPKGPGGPLLGVKFAAGGLTIASVEDGSPAWVAGLAPDDEVLAIGGLRVTEASWRDVFPQLARPGQALEVLAARQGCIVTHTVVPSDASTELEIESIAAPDERQLALRQGWIGARSV
jgi:predicted metalloprotease with PDZ domain